MVLTSPSNRSVNFGTSISTSEDLKKRWHTENYMVGKLDSLEPKMAPRKTRISPMPLVLKTEKKDPKVSTQAGFKRDPNFSSNGMGTNSKGLDKGSSLIVRDMLKNGSFRCPNGMISSSAGSDYVIRNFSLDNKKINNNILLHHVPTREVKVASPISNSPKICDLGDILMNEHSTFKKCVFASKSSGLIKPIRPKKQSISSLFTRKSHSLSQAYIQDNSSALAACNLDKRNSEDLTYKFRDLNQLYLLQKCLKLEKEGISLTLPAERLITDDHYTSNIKQSYDLMKHGHVDIFDHRYSLSTKLLIQETPRVRKRVSRAGIARSIQLTTPSYL